MQNFIPFGAQYYRAPTPQSDQWEEDLKNIKKVGFNTIKIWAQWRWNNPAEGEYYFDDVDQLMELSQDNGLKVIINAVFDVGPAWFYKKYPDSVMVKADGSTLEPQTTAYRQIGGAPGPCYHHQPGIACRQQFLEKLVRRYQNHPALYIWDLWNEPELTCGIAREPDQEDMVCYCPDSINQFKNWLKQKYETIRELNKRWNKNYQNWEEVEVPRNSHTFNDMIDWRIFFAETLTEELKMRVKAVKKYDNKHQVMVHTVPMPYFNMVNACSDDYQLAQQCDLFGNSLGSSPLAATMSVSSAPGKDIINSEIHALGGDTYNRPHIPTFNEMKKHFFIPLARGIKGFLFWQYRPETLGREAPAWGLTTLDGKKTEWMEQAVKINNTFQDNKELIVEAKPLPAKIAVINGSKNQIFDWCVSHNIDRHYNSVAGTHRALYDNQYNSDIISTDQIIEGDISGYDVIYYPFPYYLEENVAAKLKEWIGSGGTLISEVFFGGVKDVDGLHATRIPGYGFDEVFGVREGTVVTASRFMNAYGDDWAQEKDNHKLPLKIKENTLINIENENKGEQPAGYYFREELIPEGAEVLAEFIDGVPAITCNNYGQGQAVMIGTLPGYVYGKESDIATGKLISALVELGGVQPEVNVDNPLVRVDLLKGKDKGHLLIIDSSQKEKCSVRISIEAGLQSTEQYMCNLITEEKIELEKESGDITCQITLEPDACEIYGIKNNK